MLTRPRSIVFWLVLIIVLYIIATAPTEFAYAVTGVWHTVDHFFTSLSIFIRTLKTA
ncbi:hypothetical protein ACIRVI_00595 [[Kitasatospora] papulosa]|uniref:hypothetical protein n=1 Tax=[Kitasatospora] papulosa TaxID=1464011 RepID=UPI0036430491